RAWTGARFVPAGGVSASTRIFTMFDATTGATLWERPCDYVQHVPGDGLILLQESPGAPLEFLNTQTGQRVATAPIDVDSSKVASELTPDGRYVLLHGRQARHREPYFWEAGLEKRRPCIV